METLRALLDRLNMQILELQMTFHRLSHRAEFEGTVDEWARVATLGISFDRLKRHRQQLVETIADLERAIAAAGARARN